MVFVHVNITRNKAFCKLAPGLFWDVHENHMQSCRGPSTIGHMLLSQGKAGAMQCRICNVSYLFGYPTLTKHLWGFFFYVEEISMECQEKKYTG